MKDTVSNIIQQRVNDFTSACNKVHSEGLTENNLIKVTNERIGLRIQLLKLAESTDTDEEKNQINSIVDTVGEITLYYVRAYTNQQAILTLREMVDDVTGVNMKK